MRFSRAVKVVAIVAAVTVGSAGYAVASVPSPSGVIQACYSRSATRIIDVAAGNKCKSSEKPLSWSQTGPRGPRGAQGVAGVSDNPTRSDGCVLRLPRGTNAGVHRLSCPVDPPFPAGCDAFDSVVSPAYLDEHSVKEAVPLAPIVDFAWQVDQPLYGNCRGKQEVVIQVRTFKRVPRTFEYDASVSFTYIARQR